MSSTEIETAKPLLSPLQESWSGNELMRHVPALSWIVKKLDKDIRRTVEILYDPFSRLAASDPHHHELDNAFRSLGRTLERLSEVARHGRLATPVSGDLGTKLTAAINNALSCLNSIDANLFGRRFPMQTHERSKAEAVYGALLVVMSALSRVKTLVRAIDPSLDERLLDGLVVRSLPLSDEVLRPIA